MNTLLILVALLAPREALREDARAVIETHCGACHNPGSGHSKTEALAVFDLVEVEWAGRLSKAQLEDMVVRMQARQTRTDEELIELVPQGAPSLKRPTVTEIEAVRLFIIAELTR